MPAMSLNEAQPQAPPMAPPQQPMQPPPDPYDPYGDDMMYDGSEQSPFGGLEGGGPHGPPGQPSMEEMLAKAGMPKGIIQPYMKWK